MVNPIRSIGFSDDNPILIVNFFTGKDARCWLPPTYSRVGTHFGAADGWCVLLVVDETTGAVALGTDVD
jgi:hypothetical protein